MKGFGHKIWTIPEGYIPSRSVSDAHDLVSHEVACVLHTGDREADIVITLFFKDRDPVVPYRNEAIIVQHTRLDLRRPGMGMRSYRWPR